MYILALLPLYIILPLIINIIFSIFGNFFDFNIKCIFNAKETAIVYDFIINIIVIIIFLWAKDKVTEDFKSSFIFVKSHWLSLIIVFILIKLLVLLLESILELFNSSFNLNNTENQIQVINWITSDTPLFMTIIIFLSITVIGPIFEEIIFRHIIIRELGAIFSYKFMAIASIISFSYIHIISSKTIYEIIVYLILSLPLVYFYFKSNFNIFIPIYIHSSVNFTSYLFIYLYN